MKWRHPHSLRRYLLAGIVVPITLFVVFDTVGSYRRSLEAIHTAYDRSLLASARSIGRVRACRSAPHGRPSRMDLPGDPHLMKVGHWQSVDRRFMGPHLLPSVAYREGDAEFPYAIEHLAPTLGQHNEEILGELSQGEQGYGKR